MFIPHLDFREYSLTPGRLRVEIVLPRQDGYKAWKLITVLQDEDGTWRIDETSYRR